MADYEVGYGKPPKKTQYPPRKSGNPKGRPKLAPDMLGKIVREVLDAPMRYRENGRTKTATRREVKLKLLVERAVKGDAQAAELLLKKRRHAVRSGEAAGKRLLITDWLPDFLGQTAEQKTQDMMEPDRRQSRRKRKPSASIPSPNRESLPNDRG